jgi:DNA-binding NtrC family response regulator
VTLDEVNIFGNADRRGAAMRKILIVEDDKTISGLLRKHFDRIGIETRAVVDASSALDLLSREEFSMVLLDLSLPDINGLKVIGKIKLLSPNMQIIVLSNNDEVSTIVEAIKLGAADYLIKPPDLTAIEKAVDRAHIFSKLQSEALSNHSYKKIHSAYLGMNRSAQDIVDNINTIARVDFSALIQGETGTGKSYLASAIHVMSKRAPKPFIKVDVGALSETLVESELFGHVKGAFTGATQDKKGLIETASGGTIFFDEVQNIPMRIQSKLLGVVEDKKITPVGAVKPKDIDVRMIFAANEDPEKLIKEGRLRSDLYYRINEVPIIIPPLRDRPDDIKFFATKFILEICHELECTLCVLDTKVVALLIGYTWPGNIRELKNVVRRAIIGAKDGVIDFDKIRQYCKGETVTKPTPGLPTPGRSLRETHKSQEMQTIRDALKTTGGNKTKAATLLKISYRSLLSKIKRPKTKASDLDANHPRRRKGDLKDLSKSNGAKDEGH